MNCRNPGVLSATNDMCDKLDDDAKINSRQHSTSGGMNAETFGVDPYAIVDIQEVRKCG